MDLKRCSLCCLELTLDHFRRDHTRKDGFHPWCKECQRKKRKEYRNNNPITKEGEKRRHARYLKGKGRETRLIYGRKLESKERANKYRLSESGKRSSQKARLRAKESGYQKKYAKEKWNNDINYRLTKLLRNRVRAMVTKGCKSAHTLNLLGCSIDELKAHLEMQFEPGMTWDNCEEWHIDHIIPCSYFDLTKEENQRICFNYRNLQPLWAKDNVKKSNKIPNNVEEIIEFLKREIYGD